MHLIEQALVVVLALVVLDPAWTYPPSPSPPSSSLLAAEGKPAEEAIFSQFPFKPLLIQLFSSGSAMALTTSF